VAQRDLAGTVLSNMEQEGKEEDLRQQLCAGWIGAERSMTTLTAQTNAACATISAQAQVRKERPVCVPCFWCNVEGCVHVSFGNGLV